MRNKIGIFVRAHLGKCYEQKYQYLNKKSVRSRLFSPDTFELRQYINLTEIFYFRQLRNIAQVFLNVGLISHDQDCVYYKFHELRAHEIIDFGAFISRNCRC